MEPPVELSELMERIRVAAGQSRPVAPLPEEAAARPVGPAIPPPLQQPPPMFLPPGDDRERVAFDHASAAAASSLPRAQKKTEVSASVPKILRSLYRNQGGFNGIMLETLQRVLEANQHLQRQNLQLQGRLEALESAVAEQRDWMTLTADAHEQQRDWMKSVETYLLEVGGTQAEGELRHRLKHADSVLKGHDEWLSALEKQIHTMDGRHTRLGDHLKHLQGQMDDQTERHDGFLSEYRQAVAHRATLDQITRQEEEKRHSDAGYVKNQLWFLERLIEPLVSKPPSLDGHPGEGSNVPAAGRMVLPTEGHELDALYLAFENVMRGSREAVKQRVGIYLPYLAKANAGTPERPVLDLGCGRGEWLELLREHELAASGVDLNTCMVELCRERSLQVTCADVMEHFRTVPDASCGAITAFHLIEHLPVNVLVRFLRECRRVLMPDGVAIFETPNPYNVLVGSGYFYHDYTHQRPLPPTSTKFLVEQMGFSRTEIVLLHPWEESAKVHGDGATALEWRFNEFFYGPQDYALIASP